jgi:hypothetical protein
LNLVDQIDVSYVMTLNDDEFDAYIDSMTDEECEIIAQKMRDYRLLLTQRLDEFLKGV